MNEKEEVHRLYRHAFCIFLQGVLHVSELWLQALDVLLKLQLSFLAAMQLRHLLIQLAFHTVELQKTRQLSCLVHQSYPVGII